MVQGDGDFSGANAATSLATSQFDLTVRLVFGIVLLDLRKTARICALRFVEGIRRMVSRLSAESFLSVMIFIASGICFAIVKNFLSRRDVFRNSSSNKQQTL